MENGFDSLFVSERPVAVRSKDGQFLPATPTAVRNLLSYPPSADRNPPNIAVALNCGIGSTRQTNKIAFFFNSAGD